MDPKKYQFDVETPMQAVPFETIPIGQRCYFRFASDDDRQAMVGMSRYWAEKRELKARWEPTWQGINFCYLPIKAGQLKPSAPGRPFGKDYQVLDSLEVGEEAEFYHTARDKQQLYNLASRAGKRMGRKFAVTLNGSSYKVLRTA